MLRECDFTGSGEGCLGSVLALLSDLELPFLLCRDSCIQTGDAARELLANLGTFPRPNPLVQNPEGISLLSSHRKSKFAGSVCVQASSRCAFLLKVKMLI